MRDPREPPGTRRQERFGKRLGRNLLAGVVIGATAGLVVGAVAGAVFVHGMGPRLWATLLGCVIFAGAIGALIGGYGSLESPSPGREPSDTARPVRDRRALTRDEADR
jgi:uncharacterized RDD family membrane protein YckC